MCILKYEYIGFIFYIPLSFGGSCTGTEFISKMSCIFDTKSSLLAIFFRYIPMASAAKEIESDVPEPANDSDVKAGTGLVMSTTNHNTKINTFRRLDILGCFMLAILAHDVPIQLI